MQYIGQDKPVMAQASGGVDLHVYPACGPTNCDINNASYEGFLSFFSAVTWTAVGGVEHLSLVTSPVFSSGSTSMPEFELQIIDTTANDSCDYALGPITPRVGQLLLWGSTSDHGGAKVDTDGAPSCGSTSRATAPGVWYAIVGNGGAITASTCAGTDFDSQISVFTGDSCDQLTCVDGNNDACGSQSLVVFLSNPDQIYHVLVHGFGGAFGTFALRIIPTRLATLSDLLVHNYNVSIQALLVAWPFLTAICRLGLDDQRG
jgi:hypothetical protein